MSYEKQQCGSRARKIAIRDARRNPVLPKQSVPGKTIVARQYERDLTYRPKADEEIVEVEADTFPDAGIRWWTLGAGSV